MPPTEKIHQIIARTATFVHKNGGQSEIVLKVKQGDNPTFGFLMPDHHLHAYYRFLVDHQELLQPDGGGKSQNEQKLDHDSNVRDGSEGGALSLLGAVYGSGEDEDGAAECALESREKASGEAANAASSAVANVREKVLYDGGKSGKETAVGKQIHSKEKISLSRRCSVAGAVAKAGNMKKDEASSLSSDKSQDSSHAVKSKIEPLVVEPPSEIKRLVDKIVEFIMKNGKQFETALIEQDSKKGRFSFLLPSDQYHSYYLRMLQKAQESKLTGKNLVLGKTGAVGHLPGRQSFVSKEIIAGCDVPYDSDRKEKFKMVIGKSKKDGVDQPSKAPQLEFGVSVDASAVAAILQAATRGIRNPNLGFLSSASVNGSNGPSSDGGQASSGLHLSQPVSVIQRSDQNNASVPIAKVLAKTAAIEVANEADSSEAHLTREQKLKAERLKRAKMFVALLKSGAKTESSGGLSAEPNVSATIGFGTMVDHGAKEREGSSTPLDIDNADKPKISERKNSDDESNDRRSKRKYRSRRHVEDEEERDHKHSKKTSRSNEGQKKEETDDEQDHKHSKKKRQSPDSSCEEEEEWCNEDKRHHKHSKKKHRSHRSSCQEDDDNEREERDDKHSSRRHRSHRSSHEYIGDEEDEREVKHKHSRRKHRSRHSSHLSGERHKHKKRHSSSKDQESQQDKHGSSLEKDYRDREGSYSGREELEEGEINSKFSNQSRGSMDAGGLSREASIDLSSSCQDRRPPSQPSETTGVSDDLRAKIRAMLTETL